MIILASGPNGIGDGSWLSLLQYGGAVTVLTLMVVGFWKEWWVPGKVYQRRLQEVREKDAEIVRLRDYIEDRLLPAIEREARRVEEKNRTLQARRGSRGS